MFQDIETLREHIQRLNLQRLEDKIVLLAKPSIGMMTTKVTTPENLPFGASRLGGDPDVSIGFTWPYTGNKPLTFIAQFKLSELAPYDVEGVLPHHGMLYFFFEADEVPYGEADQRDGWQVLYLEDESAPVVRMTHPTYKGQWGEIKALPLHRIDYELVYTLPSYLSSHGLEFIDIPSIETRSNENLPSEYIAYWDLINLNEASPRHYWLGYPHLIQGAIE